MAAGPLATPDHRPDPSGLHGPVLRWYADHARDLPWRAPGTDAWAVFLSEVMSHQTPVARVEPIWRRWLERWPTPSALAEDSPGEAVRMWDRLGYPRRALRLHEAAVVMVRDHGGAVPQTYDGLLALPGVGPYTASAVMSFAFGEPLPVVDTNVRRVLARALLGSAHAAPALTRAESDLAAAAMPTDRQAANTWNVAVMEVGALVCTARAPRCGDCPIEHRCAWTAAGRPAHTGPPRRGQAWHGTDRQVRGRIVQALREADGPLAESVLLDVWPDDRGKAQRCLAGLIEDGLVEPDDRPDHHRLPR